MATQMLAFIDNEFHLFYTHLYIHIHTTCRLYFKMSNINKTFRQYSVERYFINLNLFILSSCKHKYLIFCAFCSMYDHQYFEI